MDKQGVFHLNDDKTVKILRYLEISWFEHIHYQFVYWHMSYRLFEKHIFNGFRWYRLQQRQQQQKFAEAERLWRVRRFYVFAEGYLCLIL